MGERKREKKKSKKSFEEVDLLGLEPESHDFSGDILSDAEPATPVKSPKKGAAVPTATSAVKVTAEQTSSSSPRTKSPSSSNKARPMADDELMAVVDSLLPEPIFDTTPATPKKRAAAPPSSSSGSEEETQTPVKRAKAAATKTASKASVASTEETKSAKSSELSSDDVTEGEYDSENQEWRYDLSTTHRLRVGKLRGRPFVDVRVYQGGSPTRKGVFLSVDVFRKLAAWKGLDKALAATANSSK